MMNTPKELYDQIIADMIKDTPVPEFTDWEQEIIESLAAEVEVA